MLQCAKGSTKPERENQNKTQTSVTSLWNNVFISISLVWMVTWHLIGKSLQKKTVNVPKNKPTSSCRFTSTPRSRRNSTILVCPAEQAQCSAVLRSWNHRELCCFKKKIIIPIYCRKKNEFPQAVLVGHVFLPGLFCRQAFYLTGCTVLISQTAPCKQSYTPPHWTPTPPFLK